jgi:hypothetical protein
MSGADSNQKTNSKKLAEISTNSSDFPKWLVVVGLSLSVMAILAISGSFAFYGITPAYIRNPESVNYSFRMQYLVEGEEKGWFESLDTTDQDPCLSGLAELPIFIDDSNRQLVQVYWRGITGGDVLKYYGLNLSEGMDSLMGYQFLEGQVLPKRINIQGQFLPPLETNQQLYIYTVNQEGYQKVKNAEFLDQDLQIFFEKYGYQDRNAPSLGNEIGSISTANLVEIDIDDGGVSDVSLVSQDSQNILINDDVEGDNEDSRLLGDVIIFVQSKEPTETDLEDRLDKFIDLENSTCKG